MGFFPVFMFLVVVAAIAVIAIEPDMPREPPISSERPKFPLCALHRRGGKVGTLQQCDDLRRHHHDVGDAFVLDRLDHGFDVEDHQHPLLRSSVPVASVARLVAPHAQAALSSDPGRAVTVQISTSRPPPSLSSSDLGTWLL